MMVAPVFLFAHGWAGSPALWSGLVTTLSTRGVDPADCYFWDQGYFGPATLPDLPVGRPVIGIGHSLGVPLLWQRGDLAALVAINGFTRFTATADCPTGTPPRLLAQMRRRFAASPAAVLDDFTQRAGLPLPDGAMQADRLAEGLEILDGVDVRSHPAPPVLLTLAGQEDVIVPPAHGVACFGPALRLVPGDHALPVTAPDLCADLVLEAASSC